MSDGLFINEDEFLNLPAKQQMGLLYKNQLETLNCIRGYKFYQKISITIGTFLVAGMGYLFNIHLKA